MTATATSIEPDTNRLGVYLKDRRARLNPTDFGFGATRRRTPGLRREEVAQLADVSVTWYTWLEQGRGGAPSAEVLDRLAAALTLTAVEREHLFLLAQGRPPEVRYEPNETISPRLRRVLDSLELSPAYVMTSTWDIVAWNRTAAAVLTDYSKLAPDQRNLVRLIFTSPHARAGNVHWESVARFVVAAFRADTERTGASSRVAELVADLSRVSPEFATFWNEHDVERHSEGTKLLNRPGVGTIALDYSAFVVEGQPNLTLVIYTPGSPTDLERIRTLVQALPAATTTLEACPHAPQETRDRLPSPRESD